MADVLLTLFLLCILAACTVCSLQKGEKNQMLNVFYTTAMKGLACIVVVLVHIPAQHSNPVQDMIGSFGFVGVTAFFRDLCLWISCKHAAR